MKYTAIAIIISVGLLLIIAICLLVLYDDSKIEIDELRNPNKLKHKNDDNQFDNIVLCKFNEYRRICYQIDYYESNIPLLKKKIRGSKLFSKSNVNKLNTELLYFCSELDKLIEIKKEIPLSLKNQFLLDTSIDNKCKKLIGLLYNKSYHSKIMNEFFGNKTAIISDNSGYLIFFESGVFYMPIELDDIYEFGYKNIKYSTYQKTRLTYEISNNDEVIGHTYEHVRKNGLPDRRYSNNAIIYKVAEYFLKISIMNKNFTISAHTKKYLNSLIDCLPNFKVVQNKPISELLIKADDLPIYIFHNIFGYGIIKGIKENDYYIEFCEGCIWIKLKEGEYKIISFDEYTNGNKESTNFRVNSVLFHPVYGKIVISNISEHTLEFFSSNGYKHVLPIESLKNLKRVDTNELLNKNYSILDYIYAPERGYGIIINIDKEFLKIRWLNNVVLEYPIAYSFLIDNVDKSLEYLKLRQYDLIYDYRFGLGRIMQFNDKNANVLYCSSDEVTRLVQISKLKKATDEEINEFINTFIEKDNRSLIFSLKANKNYYTLEECKNYYYQLFGSIPSDSMIDIIMNKSYYKKIDENIYYSQRYNTVYDYLLEESINNNVYKIDYSIETKLFNLSMKKIRNKNYMIFVDDGIYYGLKKISDSNITPSTFKLFCKSVADVLNSDKFATISLIKQKVISPINNLNLSDKALISLISANIKIILQDIGSIKLFCLKDSSSSKDFIGDLIGNAISTFQKQSVDIYEMIDYLNNKYSLELDYYNFYTLIKKVNNNKIYFSEDTEKIYANKQAYYEEVYSHES